jgi:hypothetical protein
MFTHCDGGAQALLSQQGRSLDAIHRARQLDLCAIENKSAHTEH